MRSAWLRRRAAGQVGARRGAPGHLVAVQVDDGVGDRDLGGLGGEQGRAIGCTACGCGRRVRAGVLGGIPFAPRIIPGGARGESSLRSASTDALVGNGAKPREIWRASSMSMDECPPRCGLLPLLLRCWLPDCSTGTGQRNNKSVIACAFAQEPKNEP
jgi:hypothetical protein